MESDCRHILFGTVLHWLISKMVVMPPAYNEYWGTRTKPSPHLKPNDPLQDRDDVDVNGNNDGNCEQSLMKGLTDGAVPVIERRCV